MCLFVKIVYQRRKYLEYTIPENNRCYCIAVQIRWILVFSSCFHPYFSQDIEINKTWFPIKMLPGFRKADVVQSYMVWFVLVPEWGSRPGNLASGASQNLTAYPSPAAAGEGRGEVSKFQ